MVPSCNQQHGRVDARVQAGLHIERFVVPGVGRAGDTGLKGCPQPHPSAPSLSPLHGLSCELPVIGLLQVPSILEARAEEHVLVDTTTHAVQIRSHGALGPHQGQQDSQGFLSVPWPVPPKAEERALKTCLVALTHPVLGLNRS